MRLRVALPVVALLLAGAAPRSGHDDASPAVRAMQDDDAENPGLLWVEQGAALWKEGCASCHGAPEAMRGVSAHYPQFDPALGRPVTLGGRVNQCRARTGQAPWGPDSEEMLSVTALVGRQSRGLPVAIDGSGPAQAWLQQGRALFKERQGQLNLSCAQCHDDLAGQRLGGARIPQGQPNGYPLYRLEWQGMGSLDRRLRNCLTGVRAEPLPPGSPEMAALQFYLGWRSNGLTVETPAVRP